MTFLRSFDFKYEQTYLQNNFFLLIFTICLLPNLKILKAEIGRIYNPNEHSYYRYLYDEPVDNDFINAVLDHDLGCSGHETQNFTDYLERVYHDSPGHSIIQEKYMNRHCMFLPHSSIEYLINHMVKLVEEGKAIKLHTLDLKISYYYEKQKGEDYHHEIPLLVKLLAPVVGSLKRLRFIRETNRVQWDSGKRLRDLQRAWNLEELEMVYMKWNHQENIAREVIVWDEKSVEEVDNISAFYEMR